MTKLSMHRIYISYKSEHDLSLAVSTIVCFQLTLNRLEEEHLGSVILVASDDRCEIDPLKWLLRYSLWARSTVITQLLLILAVLCKKYLLLTQLLVIAAVLYGRDLLLIQIDISCSLWAKLLTVHTFARNSNLKQVPIWLYGYAMQLLYNSHSCNFILRFLTRI